MILFFVFVIGVCIGSFLNVVSLRYNTGLSINGRSQCFSCGRTLTWYDLIPLFSFLLFRGKCRTCKSGISIQYPLVEFLTGLLFLTLFVRDGLSYFLLIDIFVWCILVVITVYDIRHKIIPDLLVALFIILSFIRLFLTIPFSVILHMPYVLDVFAGPIFFIPFFLLWFLSKGTWMGLGDGKLAVGMGALLGLKYGLSAIVLGFWIGALFSIIYLGLGKLMNTKALRNTQLGLYFNRNNLTMKSEIPFAPFLIIGLALVFFLKIDALMISSLFY